MGSCFSSKASPPPVRGSALLPSAPPEYKEEQDELEGLHKLFEVTDFRDVMSSARREILCGGSVMS